MADLDDKYLYLPKQYQGKHDICWGLVKELEEFLLDEKYIELSAQVFKLDESLLKELKNHEGDIFQFLLDHNKKEEHDHAVRLQLIRGVILDSCYFLQEALTASLKKRLSVAFSLFRRPLLYNMVMMIRLHTEIDFLEKFIQGKAHPSAKDNSFDPTKIDSNVLKRVLSEDVFFSQFFGKDIFEFVFDKSNPDSLINMTNRALHPVTSFNENNTTGAMNINFAFSTEQDTLSQWDYIYRRILFVIFFYVTLMDIVVFANIKESEETETLFNNRILNRQKLMSSTFGQ
jgi:hypothetical protein